MFVTSCHGMGFCHPVAGVSITNLLCQFINLSYSTKQLLIDLVLQEVIAVAYIQVFIFSVCRVDILEDFCMMRRNVTIKTWEVLKLSIQLNKFCLPLIGSELVSQCKRS